MFISAPVLAGISVGSAVLAVLLLLWLQRRSEAARMLTLAEQELAEAAQRRSDEDARRESVKEGVVLRTPAPPPQREFIKHREMPNSQNIPRTPWQENNARVPPIARVQPSAPAPRSQAPLPGRFRSDRPNVANTPKSLRTNAGQRLQPSVASETRYTDDDSAEQARRVSDSLLLSSLFTSSDTSSSSCFDSSSSAYDSGCSDTSSGSCSCD